MRLCWLVFGILLGEKNWRGERDVGERRNRGIGAEYIPRDTITSGGLRSRSSKMFTARVFTFTTI